MAKGKNNNLSRLLHFVQERRLRAISDRKLFAKPVSRPHAVAENTPPLPSQLRTALRGREKVFTCRLAPSVAPGLTALQICRL
jgi:hypothetical protein